MDHDAMGYTVALGLPALRQKIAGLYGEWYDVDLDPARVVITPGSSGALSCRSHPCLMQGACWDWCAWVSQLSPNFAPWIWCPLISKPSLKIACNLLHLNWWTGFGRVVGGLPANPTGTMLDRAALSSLIDATQDAGGAFISDEIYHGIEYEAKAVSALEITDDCYVINSFSKYFSMTGWRVGWMVVPEDHIRQVERLAQNMFICSPHASQLAALAAMDAHDELQENLNVYRKNRALMMRAAQSGVYQICAPDGAFYVYVDVSEYTDDSLAFSNRFWQRRAWP